MPCEFNGRTKFRLNEKAAHAATLSPTVVIAHGAWIDATGWREVIALLRINRVNVVAAQSPLSSLADDVGAMSRAINQLSDPVVLLGDGYGGTVITDCRPAPRAGSTGNGQSSSSRERVLPHHYWSSAKVKQSLIRHLVNSLPVAPC